MSFYLKGSTETVEIGGRAYKFDADFRNFIQMEQLMRDSEVTDELRLLLLLNLFYPEIPEDASGAVEEILKVYSGDAQPDGSEGRPRGSGKRIYDFNQDAEYIYSAFKADYDLDLIDVEFLHWSKFQSMFIGLKPDNLICKIMEYRSADTSKMKGEQKAFYRKMQRQFRLEESGAKSDHLAKVREALLSGGDLTGLV